MRCFWAWGMGHGAWGMGHGAWGMGHGAWGMGHGALARAGHWALARAGRVPYFPENRYRYLQRMCEVISHNWHKSAQRSKRQ